MFDSLCQWPFLSWLTLVGVVLWLVARGRMGDERQEMVAGTMPDQFRVDSKHPVQSAGEGSTDYEVRFTDSDGNTQSVRVSKSTYENTEVGDMLTVYPNPAGTAFVHESDPLSFSRLSTTILWVLAWVLIFVGIVDLAIYAIIDESPWCVVIRR